MYNTSISFYHTVGPKLKTTYIFFTELAGHESVRQIEEK